ncbi:MAG TPA: hypothetical protein GXZ64_08435 [Clostridiaceae bacterium]|jgi:hypothetical protein|nr:hypothetical protein [Clostridiaceae bacterium]
MSENKTTMDYKQEMAAFKPLEITDVPTFGSIRQSERAVYGYNRMLEQFANGNEDIAKIALEKIAGDFPLFVEAKHMYALSLAADSQFAKAEKLLRDLLLLDLTEAETNAIEAQLTSVHKDGRQQAAAKKRSSRENDRLIGVRAKLATASILQPAGGDRHVGMASEREVEAVMKQIERGETDDRIEVEDLRPAVRSKAGPIIFLVIMLAGVLAAAWMLFLRPVRLEQKNIERRVFWLEQQMTSRRDSADIAALQDAYEQFVRTLE